jgi:hypothetical protein
MVTQKKLNDSTVLTTLAANITAAWLLSRRYRQIIRPNKPPTAHRSR